VPPYRLNPPKRVGNSAFHTARRVEIVEGPPKRDLFLVAALSGFVKVLSNAISLVGSSMKSEFQEEKSLCGILLR